eukprot:SAG31_NODE_6408_length_2014_cov_1.395132_2_plen_166_part_00
MISRAVWERRGLYYLGLTKAGAVADKVDVLATTLLSNYSFITWQLVASAVPPIRRAGVRAAVGSRGSVADTKPSVMQARTLPPATRGFSRSPTELRFFSTSRDHCDAEGGSPIQVYHSTSHSDGSTRMRLRHTVNSSLMAPFAHCCLLLPSRREFAVLTAKCQGQ